ncbi:MAG: nitrite/sulfite reductase [Actinomycetota bacterium]
MNGEPLNIPRPKRGSEGQWGMGYREPLNAAEQMKRDDNPLNVKDRIFSYAEQWKRGEISSVDNIFVADLRSRFRWYGLYTQRPEEDGYFMWRIRIPGGVLTSDQTRAIGNISKEFGRDVADITDRQNIQLHWIRLTDVPEIWERLEAVGLQTTEACGDTPRNILGCPLAGVDADEIIDGTELVLECNERIVGDPEFSNLPRKYKPSITGCRHQCAVHEANDVSYVGNELDDGTKGFDLWVGGGLSSTPHFAQRLGVFVKPEQVVETFVGVTSIFRDYGYRRSRNKARLKFLMAEWGPDLFRRVLEEKYLGYQLADGPMAKPSSNVHRDHTGVGRQKDGQNYLGFALRNGRITGTELNALADLADAEGQGRLRATPLQKMVLLDIPDERLAATMDSLDDLGFPVFASAFRNGMMACTGIEFCKLSIVETKARAEWLYGDLEKRLPDFDEPIRINVNGCPNSCARYQLADLGFMGVLVTEKVNGNGEVDRLEGFNVHLGGHLGEPRAFGQKVRGLRLRADELSSFAERVIRLYQSQRNGHRSFGEWITSLDPKKVNALAQEAAKGLERVGPKPVAEEDIRPNDDRDEERERFHQRIATTAR